MIVATSFLFDFMRVATCDLTLALTLRGCDLEYIKLYNQFPLLIFQVSLYHESIKIDTKRYVILHG
jgi:hypothetical protein